MKRQAYTLGGLSLYEGGPIFLFPSKRGGVADVCYIFRVISILHCNNRNSDFVCNNRYKHKKEIAARTLRKSAAIS